MIDLPAETSTLGFVYWIDPAGANGDDEASPIFYKSAELLDHQWRDAKQWGMKVTAVIAKHIEKLPAKDGKTFHDGQQIGCTRI